MNSRLLAEAGFERIFIQPAASDAGNALGAALRVWRQRLGRPRGQAMTHAFYGADWRERERAEGLTGQGWRSTVLAADSSYVRRRDRWP